MDHSRKSPIKPLSDEIDALDKRLSKKPTLGLVPFCIGAVCATLVYTVVYLAYHFLSHP